MPDLQHDLAALESRYAEADQALADRKTEQQADLNARAAAFMQETIPMAQELVKIEGMIDYVKDKMRQPQDEPDVQERIRTLLAEIATLQRIIANQNAREEQPIPAGEFHDAVFRAQFPDAPLTSRIHRKQDADRFAAAIPDNDPD